MAGRKMKSTLRHDLCTQSGGCAPLGLFANAHFDSTQWLVVRARQGVKAGNHVEKLLIDTCLALLVKAGM
jgi:hypothetical protein